MNASPEMVREVFARVLEKQVFLFAEDLDTAELPESGEWVEARMYFHGPFGGSLSLALPKEAQLEIAANFLGKDADDPDVAKCAEDSLKEILNVACGHMLTALAGEEPVFDLSIPKVHALSLGDRNALAALPGTLGFDVEGRPALLRFQSIEAGNP
ncbi:MAG TPA: chemotaxis protein CheX [Fibrobacteria bacterium]|nr:chemotaxis protein CheX [Fibrobacteria bacterium]